MFIAKLQILAYFEVSILERKDINYYIRSYIINSCLKNINQLCKFYSFKIIYNEDENIIFDLIKQ